MDTFEKLGLCETLTKICEERGWSHPTPIQVQAIPPALQRKDVIGLAQTGSGKTGAFALPILNDLLLHQRPCPSAVVLAPTRFISSFISSIHQLFCFYSLSIHSELAFQIYEEFRILGSSIGLKCAVLVGGVGLFFYINHSNCMIQFYYCCSFVL